MTETKIIFDLDETLIHSFGENKSKISYCSPCGLSPKKLHKGYETFVRPIAHRMIGLAQRTVGKDNVFIGTVSLKDYGDDICTKEFGIEKNKIYGREEIAWGLTGRILPFERSKNILIDNLVQRKNQDKIKVFNISENGYIKCPSFTPFLKPYKIEEDMVFLDFLTEKLQSI